MKKRIERERRRRPGEEDTSVIENLGILGGYFSLV